jgi:sarcosine oxidase subunit delta
MKLLKCPINGTRPISEFVYGGTYREMPDHEIVTDSEWAAYVHYRDNAPGLKKEWWYHLLTRLKTHTFLINSLSWSR